MIRALALDIIRFALKMVAGNAITASLKREENFEGFRIGETNACLRREEMHAKSGAFVTLLPGHYPGSEEGQQPLQMTSLRTGKR